MKRATLGKIVKETVKEIYDESENLKSNVSDFVKGLIKYSSVVSSLFHVIPTFSRIVRESEENIGENLSTAEHMGSSLGYTIGVFGGYYLQGAFYLNAIKNKNYGYLLIPLATNLASAVYEKTRKVKQRLESEPNGLGIV